jgi:hypothetical protein
MVITYRQKFLFAKALAELIHVSEVIEGCSPSLQYGARMWGYAQPPPCPTVFEYRPNLLANQRHTKQKIVNRLLFKPPTADMSGKAGLADRRV